MLVCALHSQDTALDAPWASEESSAAAMGILTELAHSMRCTDAGTCLCQTLSWLWCMYRNCRATACVQVDCNKIAACMAML